MSDPTPADNNADAAPAGPMDAKGFHEQQQEMGDETHNRRIGSFFLVALLGLGFLVLTRTLMVDSEPMRSDSALIDDSTALEPSAVNGQIEIPPLDAGATSPGSGDALAPVPDGSANAPQPPNENPQ